MKTRQALDRRRLGLGLTALMACLGLGALLLEFSLSLEAAAIHGQSLGRATFEFFRFFTNLTNLGLAILMANTSIRLAGGQRLRPASFYAAALVYMIVTGLTYELMLRASINPQGLHFYTDGITHDVLPVLTLIFWIVFSPKAPLHLGHAALWLGYPLVYFGAVMLAGHWGLGYPYRFLDPRATSQVEVAKQFAIFTLAFAALGAGAVLAARKFPVPDA